MKLYCLRTDNGAVVWKRDFTSEPGSTIIPWQNAASPLMVGGLLFVNCNSGSKHLLAVNKADGKTVWSSQTDTMTHSTPVYAQIGGVPQVIFLTLSGLVSLSVDGGTLLWRLPFTPSTTSTAASPVVMGDYVHASANYAAGTWIAHVEKTATGFGASLVKHQQGNAYQCHWSTAVAQDGFIYGIPSPSSAQARLACLDVAAGTNRWTTTTVGTGPIGFGSIIKAANALIVVTEAGELVLVNPNPDSYTEIAKYKALDLYSWNHPALSNGRLYARNSSLNSKIVALDIAPAIAPLPAVSLVATATADAGKVRIAIVSEEQGRGLTSQDIPRLELRTSTELTLPPLQWGVITPNITVEQDRLVFELSVAEHQALFVLAKAKGN
jgi:outer membrane protein assembly factor BamB